MKTLFRCLSICPLWLLHGLGWLLGWAAFGLSHTYRKRLLANARQAGYSLADVRAAVGEAGKLVAELPRLWLGAQAPIFWQGSELIDAALAQRRGIVFMTPHMGCFEATAQGFARRYGPGGQSITVLYRPARKAWLRALVGSARARPGLLAAPTTLGGVKQLIKALKNGQAVGLLPDQVPPAHMGVWAPFFGQPAYTMTLAARLAQQPDAAVLIAWGERLAWGRGYCIHLSAPQQAWAPGLETAATQINAEMERIIRQRPGHYLWGYARYKRPAGLVATADTAAAESAAAP
ncbi:MAG: lysophospholipid acyltransferase family protein [Burkholderiales bacterium]